MSLLVTQSPLLNRALAVLALLLVVTWLPITSHELLESSGIIHHDGPEADDGPAHEAADGLCRIFDGGIFAKAPTLFALSWVVPALALSITALVIIAAAEDFLHRATESPPGLVRTWQFVLRQALPSRAPSFAL
jgi:hypothetical protein